MTQTVERSTERVVCQDRVPHGAHPWGVVAHWECPGWTADARWCGGQISHEPHGCPGYR